MAEDYRAPRPWLLPGGRSWQGDVGDASGLVPGDGRAARGRGGRWQPVSQEENPTLYAYPVLCTVRAPRPARLRAYARRPYFIHGDLDGCVKSHGLSFEGTLGAAVSQTSLLRARIRHLSPITSPMSQLQMIGIARMAASAVLSCPQTRADVCFNLHARSRLTLPRPPCFPSTGVHALQDCGVGRFIHVGAREQEHHEHHPMFLRRRSSAAAFLLLAAALLCIDTAQSQPGLVRARVHKLLCGYFLTRLTNPKEAHADDTRQSQGFGTTACTTSATTTVDSFVQARGLHHGHNPIFIFFSVCGRLLAAGVVLLVAQSFTASRPTWQRRLCLAL